MTTPEKIELALIPLVVAAVGAIARFLPGKLELGELLTFACLAWLLQGGVRDGWFLYALKSRRLQTTPRKMACMCLESSIGLPGILLGVVLTLLGVGPSLTMNSTCWTVTAAIVLLGGFLLKDFVVTWRPLGIRRERDHHGIVFSWR